jgi:hypothetical protein
MVISKASCHEPSCGSKTTSFAIAADRTGLFPNRRSGNRDHPAWRNDIGASAHLHRGAVHAVFNLTAHGELVGYSSRATFSPQ